MRENYDTSHGKFESPMAHYVYDMMMEGMSDESWSTWWGDWADRIGKRIVFGDDRGFVYLTRYDNVDKAAEGMEWLYQHYGTGE